MRILVLFAGWVPDTSPNSRAWTDFYRTVLSEKFSDCDKVICVNSDCDASMGACFMDVPRVIASARVRLEDHINSDAASFHTALRLAAPMLSNYDTVVFLHTKGASKPYESLEGFRWLFSRRILDADLVTSAHVNNPSALCAVYCHPITEVRNISLLQDLVSSFDKSLRPFGLNVTYTIYSCCSRLVARAILLLGDNFLRDGISNRYDRFFFEHMFPSLLISIGGKLTVLDRAEYNPVLNKSLSYNHDLPHSTAIIMELYHQYCVSPSYRLQAVPMIFGSLDVTRSYAIKFSL